MEIRVPNSKKNEYEAFCNKRNSKVKKQYINDVVLEIANLTLTEDTLRGEGGNTGIGSLRIERAESNGKNSAVLTQVLCQSGEKSWHSRIRAVYAISKDRKIVLFVGFVTEHQGSTKAEENYRKLKESAVNVTEEQLTTNYYRPMDGIARNDAVNTTKLTLTELLFQTVERLIEIS